MPSLLRMVFCRTDMGHPSQFFFHRMIHKFQPLAYYQLLWLGLVCEQACHLKSEDRLCQDILWHRILEDYNTELKMSGACVLKSAGRTVSPLGKMLLQLGKDRRHIL